MAIWFRCGGGWMVASVCTSEKQGSVIGGNVDPAIYAVNIEMGDCWLKMYLDRQHGAFWTDSIWKPRARLSSQPSRQ
jgi:hypothetical protein